MKSILIDMTARIVGRLEVLARAETSADGKAYWKCLCKCGTVCIILGKSLRNGMTRSCGCLKADVSRTRATTHNLHKSRAYRSWTAAKARCSNANMKAFPRYGGRGITMAAEWVDDFGQFFRDMGERPIGYTLERQNNDLGYQPGNCIWASRTEQAQNTSKNRFITLHGKTKSTSQWERDLGFKPGTMKTRLLRGWTIERAMSTPTRRW